MPLRRWMFSTLRAERRRGQVLHVSALKKSPTLNTGRREIKSLHLCCKKGPRCFQRMRLWEKQGEPESRELFSGLCLPAAEKSPWEGDQSFRADGAEQPFSPQHTA